MLTLFTGGAPKQDMAEKTRIGFNPGEIDALMKEFYELSSNIAKDRMSILNASSKILVSEIKSNVPIGGKVHKRYSTPKVIKSRRAKKGSGVVVATYFPGNLRFSFRSMKFRRSKSAVFVGAVLAKGEAHGVFSNSAKADGYYAHMVDRGTKKKAARPFMERSVAAAGPGVLEDIKTRVNKHIVKLNKKK